MNIDDANHLIIRMVLQRLAPEHRLDSVKLQEQIVEVVKEQGENIFAQLSEEERAHLRREGRQINQQSVHLKRIEEVIEFGRLLAAKYKVKTLGELPQKEQIEFARLWANATGGAKLHEN